MATDRSPKTARDRMSSQEWQRCLPVYVIVSLYAAGMAAVLPVLPFYVRDMGGSPFTLGMVVATEALSQFTSAPVLGQLSDRFGRKRILLVSQLTGSVSLLMLAVAPGIVMVMLARALFGMTAGNIPVAAACIAEYTLPAYRRQTMGILTGSVGLGGIVGAALSGLLSEYSLATPLFAAVILTLVAAIVTFFLPDNGPVVSLPVKDAGSAGVSFRAVLMSPVIRTLIIVMLCHCFAYGLYSSQMPVFLGETFIWEGHAFGTKQLSYIIMADGIINVLVQIFLLGWLSRYVTERNLILLIFTLIGCGFVVAGLAGTIPVLALAVLCISTGDALAKPTYLAALSVHAPPERQGVVLGSAQAMNAVTDIFSPLLGGFILGYALYGIWLGTAVSAAIAGAVMAFIYLPKGIPEAVAAKTGVRTQAGE
ncbi:MFS transporter [Klebsiella quasipneumoniae]|uniref:MFS transporter n=1 Tax=Klebsiella quasipneumoniae TaxID=1463165 RepID=UPI0029AF7694|nr:MFS transporter [Klebsiella quasipneumoniae]EJN1757933.1 MFS transporter [Escherichia coli]HBR1015629.1 MFS transporter [Klebsiella quasipneumoniae subsp. similipneumoniae]HBR1235652.1 MFS transporter [Klebsiella pneumoniae]HBR1600480.1 MFS transporter [Klebsiella quasipneumoniae subsp. quasipneumoniae]MEB6597629.1 MFS transporter [Klebsiella quasipneumoniae]